MFSALGPCSPVRINVLRVRESVILLFHRSFAEKSDLAPVSKAMRFFMQNGSCFLPTAESSAAAPLIRRPLFFYVHLSAVFVGAAAQLASVMSLSLCVWVVLYGAAAEPLCAKIVPKLVVLKPRVSIEACLYVVKGVWFYSVRAGCLFVRL